MPRTYDQIAESMNGTENGQGNIYRVSSRVIKALKK